LIIILILIDVIVIVIGIIEDNFYGLYLDRIHTL
jgi:hypothetical protein